MFALGVTAAPAFAGRDDGMTPADGFFVPEGDAAAGRQAFVDLKCFSCHRVYDQDFPAPTAAQPGPVLGLRQMDYSVGWLMNGIVNPSHTISTGASGLAPESELSRMGDFTDAMSVRQLINLAAFFKSLPAGRGESGEEAAP
jgi:hypothetical protein